MGRLVQGIQGQPAPGVGNGHLVLSQGAVSPHQPLQGRGQLLAEALGLEELPLVKGRAVAEAEAAHKVPPIQLDRLGQGPQALGADLGFGMAVPLPGPQQLTELGYIQPDARPGIGADALPVHDQPLSAERFSEHREVAAQTRTSPAWIHLWPEQGHQRLAGVRFPRHRKIGDEGQVLPRIETDWLAVAFEQGCPKQQSPQPRHKDPLDIHYQ